MIYLKIQQILFSFFVCISFIQITQSTLSKNSKKSDGVSGLTHLSVEEKDLVKSNIKWKEIVTHHKSYFSNITRKFSSGLSLGYVTPWNNHGYDVAKIFAKKFTHISPVWLQLIWENGALKIIGDHDIDKSWIKEIKKKGQESNLKVVPRILFERWTKSNFKELIQSSGVQEELIETVAKFLKKHNLDGFVFEIWNQLPSADLIDSMPGAISKIAENLRSSGFQFILVIPPPMYHENAPGIFRRKELQKLVDSVDAFSLMTYDYSNFQSPGPNSPLNWMKKCVEHLVPDSTSEDRRKILMGINLYGLDHSPSGGSHVFGDRYIETLSNYKPKFQYDEASKEHFFEYKSPNGRHTVFYPTLHSINERIKLARQLGTGLSFWEIGQGQDFFYDLL